MAAGDNVVSGMAAATTWVAEDLLYLIKTPNGTPAGKKITVKNFFGAINANVVMNQRATLAGNTTIRCSNVHSTANVNITGSALLRANNIAVHMRSAPGSNNALTGGFKLGQIWASNTHIYVAVNSTTIKRAALSAF